MALVARAALLSKLCPPLDLELTTQLVDEFVSLQKRFALRDWEPAQLDGGQFCELLGRILYHQDSGNSNRAKDLSKCLEYLESDSNIHRIVPRHDAIHLAKVIKTIYKFRSQRGAVHISPNYKPNHMDAKLVADCVHWCFAEVLRVFGSGDRDTIARYVRELLSFSVPSIGQFGNTVMVQRVGLKPEEEILLLLHYAGDDGFSRRKLGEYAQLTPPQVTKGLQALASPRTRQVIAIENGNYRLTDLGSKRVLEELAEHLSL